MTKYLTEWLQGRGCVCSEVWVYCGVKGVARVGEFASCWPGSKERMPGAAGLSLSLLLFHQAPPLPITR